MSYLLTLRCEHLSPTESKEIKFILCLDWEPEGLELRIEFNPFGTIEEPDIDFFVKDLFIYDEHGENTFLIKNTTNIFAKNIIQKFFPVIYNRIKMEQIFWQAFTKENENYVNSI